ncbi:MAG: DUF924 family protein [Pseudomonadota bacterium]
MDLARQLLDYWYSPRLRTRWFASTPTLDEEIRSRWEALWRRGLTGELDGWSGTSEGALALVILLDQLPLNMFRGRAEAFASERQAVAAARRAVDQGFDQAMAAEQRLFLYMPFMHSEDLAEQDLSVDLFSRAGMDTRWPEHHRAIVRRFGRFPHRNAILGRPSTAEELAWLASAAAFTG